MIRQIDHVVIVVQSLEDTIARYGEFGFTVTLGGQHTSRATHNALVAFEDGSYLELIAYLDEGAKGSHRWGRKLGLGGGVVDVCLASDNLVDDAARAQASGLAYTTPFDMGRKRPDGQEVLWQLSSAPEDGPAHLPFLIIDKTPRTLRTGENTEHANGVTGIVEVIIATADLERAAAAYRQLLDQDGSAPAVRGDLGGNAVSFALGSGAITLVAPDQPDNTLAKHLDHWGESTYAIVLSARDSGLTGDLDLEKAQNARISIVRS